MAMKSVLSTLENQSILILGLGREGISTYKFLRKHFPEKKLTLADKQPLEKLNTKLISLLHQDENVVLQLEEKHLNNLSTSDVIFKSPGIPASLAAIQQATARGVKLSSNTQLFFDLLEEKREKNTNNLSDPKFLEKNSAGMKYTPEYKLLTTNPTIGVTGTKGKSTTTALIHHVLKENDLDTVLLGNIGTPPLDKIKEIASKTIIVIELSCHQLAELTHSPHIAVVQEITSEHLDYYSTTEAYVEAKSAICRHQNENDIVIYNQNYPKTSEISKLSPGKHLIHADLIKQESEHKATPLWENYPNLPGKHNQDNIIPAIIVGRLFDLDNNKIRQAISSFKTLPHRLQLVARIDGIRYYNDSLSTTPEATIAALNAFENTPIVLIAGGYERYQNFSELAKVILGVKNKNTNYKQPTTNIKALILFPTTGQRIEEEIEKQYKNQNPEIVNKDETPELLLTPYPLPITNLVETMPEAIEIAKKHAQPGDIVLLSPASASFNSFKDYADRGEQFEKEVLGN